MMARRDSCLFVWEIKQTTDLDDDDMKQLDPVFQTKTVVSVWCRDSRCHDTKILSGKRQNFNFLFNFSEFISHEKSEATFYDKNPNWLKLNVVASFTLSANSEWSRQSRLTRLFYCLKRVQQWLQKRCSTSQSRRWQWGRSLCDERSHWPGWMWWVVNRSKLKVFGSTRGFSLILTSLVWVWSKKAPSQQEAASNQSGRLMPGGILPLSTNPACNSILSNNEKKKLKKLTDPKVNERLKLCEPINPRCPLKKKRPQTKTHATCTI